MSSYEPRDRDVNTGKKSPKSGTSKPKKKSDLDVLTEDFFEEDSTTSEDDDEFKGDPLEFSESSDSDSKSKQNSDEDMQSSDEEQLLNLYDQKLRDKVSTKKNKPCGDEPEERMTSRIADYMKKMRNEEKKITSRMEAGDGKLKESDVAKNRRNKESLLKKFDYKLDHLKPMKGKNYLPKFDSSDSESTGSLSDSEVEGLVDQLAKMKAGKHQAPTKQPASKSKPPDLKKKITTSRDSDVQKKLAEMKKMIDSPRSTDFMDEHLLKAKQRVNDWMKEEEAKTASMREHMNSTIKYPPEHSVHESSSAHRAQSFLKGARNIMDLPKGMGDLKAPLPPVKSKRPGVPGNLGLKREDVLSMLKDVENSSFRGKPTRPVLDKNRTSISSPTIKKVPSARIPMGAAAAKMPQSKAEAIKSSIKPTPKMPTSTTKIGDKKPTLKKPPTIKRNLAI